MMGQYTNGEHWLLINSPIFKRRYGVDCDIVIGCTIGCKFCYYRWVEGMEGFIGTGRTKALCSPEVMVDILTSSKLVRKDRDLLMLCARSDGVVQVEEVRRFLEVFPWRNPVFVLHRGYFRKRQLDAFGADDRVVFSTTLTPKGRELGWTPIDETEQLKGLELLVSNGIPVRRISVEVGPINELNVDRAVELLRELEELGLEFATYRGVSVGTFGLPSPEDGLKQIGFLTGQRENAPDGHAYYRIKNVLSDEVESRVKGAVSRMRLHRFTGTLYRDEFGLDIAYNRCNRRRAELGEFRPANPLDIGDYVEWLGLSVLDVSPVEDGYLVFLRNGFWATEDIAMTVGAEFNTCVLFNRYRLGPTMDDVRFYVERGLVKVANGVRP